MQLETTSTRYNGWTNYETWRVNLELFDGFDVSDYAPECIRDDDAYSLSKLLQEYAENAIDQDGTLEGLAVDYALAFLAGVNWYEIAEHLLDAIRDEVAA